MNYLDLGDVDGAHPAVVEDGHVPPRLRRRRRWRRRRSSRTSTTVAVVRPRPEAQAELDAAAAPVTALLLVTGSGAAPPPPGDAATVVIPPALHIIISLASSLADPPLDDRLDRQMEPTQQAAPRRPSVGGRLLPLLWPAYKYSSLPSLPFPCDALDSTRSPAGGKRFVTARTWRTRARGRGRRLPMPGWLAAD